MFETSADYSGRYSLVNGGALFKLSNHLCPYKTETELPDPDVSQVTDIDGGMSPNCIRLEIFHEKLLYPYTVPSYEK